MTVWLCSGQGAQKPGMGADLLDIPEVAEVFETMSEGLELDLVNLATKGTTEEVNDTEAAQALTMAVSVGLGRALRARGFAPDAIIGFSLGQISALVLADVLSLEDATALLKVRSKAMAQACAVPLPVWPAWGRPLQAARIRRKTKPGTQGLSLQARPGPAPVLQGYPCRTWRR